MHRPFASPISRRLAWTGPWLLAMLLTAALSPWTALAQDHGAAKAPAQLSPAKAIGEQVRQALEAGVVNGKTMTVSPGDKATPVRNPKASRQYIRAKAAALAAKTTDSQAPMASTETHGDAHWAYDGAHGPLAWADLKPEFATCGNGKQQSPINIDESQTLRGPAEALVFDYSNSSASVVNNGHTIQIDVAGDNGMTVRGTRYQLLQLHFHHPAEERINHRGFAMVAHLVHKDYLGRLAVVAVLLEPGAANPVINNFWTYMPLGAGDRVMMPRGSVDLGGLLPKDQRYYQFMGSLTTPPCTEDVLWMILKEPVTLSPAQMRLFAQQFPNNARPVQPINGRVVRDAQ